MGRYQKELCQILVGCFFSGGAHPVLMLFAANLYGGEAGFLHDRIKFFKA